MLKLIEKQFMGSSYERVKRAVIESSKTDASAMQPFEKEGNLHFHELVFEFSEGKLTAVRAFN